MSPKNPQLDAFRAFAILAVIVGHSFPQGSLIEKAGFSFLGVRLFYVLSGFLITRILLRARLQAQDLTQSLAPKETGSNFGVLKAFYARRFLRIFPAYYFVLFLFAFLGLKPLIHTFFWHFFYLSNYYMAWKGHWLDPISHFWSLGVEEQFYLFWPWVILFVPFKRLKWVLLLTIAFSPALRFVLGALTHNGITTKSPGFSCMDMLGLGAALAYVHLVRGASSPAARRFARTCLVSGSVLFVATVFAKVRFGMWALGAATLDFSTALIFTWMVDAGTVGVRGALGRLLEWKPLLYIGKISYGIYLYHMLMPWLADRISGLFGGSSWVPAPGPGRFVFMLVTGVAVASLSWNFLERPLNEMKERFPYLPSGAKTPGRLAEVI